MTNLREFASFAAHMNNFRTLDDYINFSNRFLDYLDKNHQAIIVSENEEQYRFYQFTQEAGYKVSRPFNSELKYSSDETASAFKELKVSLNCLKTNRDMTVIEDRHNINRCIYTLQQSIGFALDAGTALGVEPNRARKLNGELFEHLIRIIIQELGIECQSGIVNVPVVVDNQALFDMKYQHDLIVTDNEDIKMIGSVKTTSKDRVDKIFIDKYLYSILTDSYVPHVAIFLHDVQRKAMKQKDKFAIASTFKTGHFKGYTIKLNPLDGVYYFDIRPIMQEDKILKTQINTFDKLVCEDIWSFVK